MPEHATAAPALGGQRADRTAIVALTLTHFRNFRELALTVESAPVVLTGPNGSGKTNVLEAISMLAPGSGLRQARLGDIDMRLPGNSACVAWGVHAEVIAPGGCHSMGTGRDAAAARQIGRERRICRLNGATVKSQASFSDVLAIQWLVPSMDRLFDDGPAARRRFLDRLVGNVDPAQAQRLGAYEAALRERGRILRGELAVAPGERSTWLDGLEAEMAQLAIAIGAARIETVRLLNDVLVDDTGAFPRAELAVMGAVEDWLMVDSALLAEEKLRERLKEARPAESETGITQWGAHRSDLAVHYAGRDLGGRRQTAQDSSTGEQRALLLSIMLAEARLVRRLRGQMPVLLLDEALVHLDARRRHGLFEEVTAAGLQAWMTGVEAGAFGTIASQAQFIRLEHGQAWTLSGTKQR